jgi:hypothetical protein
MLLAGLLTGVCDAEADVWNKNRVLRAKKSDWIVDRLRSLERYQFEPVWSVSEQNHQFINVNDWIGLLASWPSPSQSVVGK